LVLATVAAGMLVYRAAGTLVSPLSAARVVTSLSACIFAGRLMAPRGIITTLGSAVVLVCIYFVLLVALRELNRSDLQHVAIVVKRRGASR